MRTIGFVIAASFLSLVGCGGARSGSDSFATEAAAATDSVEAAQAQAALVATTVEGATFQVNNNASAQAAADSVTAAMTPTGCATSVVTNNQVVYNFSNCTGSYGLVALNGSITATYTSTLTTVSVQLTSSNLTLNQLALQLTGTATYTAGATQTISFATTSTATGSRGHTVTASGTMTIGFTASTDCTTYAGNWNIGLDQVSWSTMTTNYQRCGTACPASGTVTLTGPAHALTLTFDGTSSLDYTTSTGETGTVTLSCG